MKPSARILGALTLAAGLAATMIIVAPTRFPRFEHWLAAKAAQQSNTPTDPPVFYRDPMGQKVFSRTPRKDRMGMDFLPVRRSDIETLLTRLPAIPAHSAEEPLFYRDAMGGSEISSVPKTELNGNGFSAREGLPDSRFASAYRRRALRSGREAHSLLSESDGSAGHLAGSKKGFHGHGLPPRLRGG